MDRGRRRPGNSNPSRETQVSPPELPPRRHVVIIAIAAGACLLLLIAWMSPWGRARGGSSQPLKGVPLEAVNAAVPDAPPAVAAPAAQTAELEPRSRTTIEDRFGIKITRVTVVARGNGLDIRYVVTDPEKAATLLYSKELTYVVDEATHKTLPMHFQKENQTSQKLVAGKTYFALLANQGQLIKPGSTVCVAFGYAKTQNLIVE